MGNNTDTKLEPAEAKKVRDALNTEMTNVKNTKLEPLASINSIAFGLSSPGQSLWTQVDQAATHVNVTLGNLHQALSNYHDAFANAQKGIQETESQVTADAKLLTTGAGLIQKPFYENKQPKKGQPQTEPQALFTPHGGGPQPRMV